MQRFPQILRTKVVENHHPCVKITRIASPEDIRFSRTFG
jgi:hypothetical protein